MTEDEKKLIDQARRQQERIKRQNEKIKQNYDRVSITLPKGTKEKIIEKGETLNGLLNKLVLEWLENN